MGFYCIAKWRNQGGITPPPDFENNVLAHETMLAVVCAMKGSFLSHLGPSTNAPASRIQNLFQTPYRCGLLSDRRRSHVHMYSIFTTGQYSYTYNYVLFHGRSMIYDIIGRGI